MTTNTYIPLNLPTMQMDSTLLLAYLVIFFIKGDCLIIRLMNLSWLNLFSSSNALQPMILLSFIFGEMQLCEQSHKDTLLTDHHHCTQSKSTGALISDHHYTWSKSTGATMSSWVYSPAHTANHSSPAWTDCTSDVPGVTFVCSSTTFHSIFSSQEMDMGFPHPIQT